MKQFIIVAFLITLSQQYDFDMNRYFASTASRSEPQHVMRDYGFQDHDGSSQGSDYSIKIDDPEIETNSTDAELGAGKSWFMYTDHGHEVVDDSEFDPKTKGIVKLFWGYEHRKYYKHSYVILQTADSDLYVSEKNDLGVIWQKAWKNEDGFKKRKDRDVVKKTKVEHDGSRWDRKSVNQHKMWLADLNEDGSIAGQSITIGEIKAISRFQTKYVLLDSNCHHYAKLLFDSVSKTNKEQQHSEEKTLTYKDKYINENYDFWELFSVVSPNDFKQGKIIKPQLKK